MSPETDLLLQAGKVAFLNPRDLSELRRALREFGDRECEPTLDAVRTAAVEMLAAGVPEMREGWRRTLESAVEVHLEAITPVLAAASAPRVRGAAWTEFKAKCSRPVTEAQIDSWREREDLK